MMHPTQFFIRHLTLYGERCLCIIAVRNEGDHIKVSVRQCNGETLDTVKTYPADTFKPIETMVREIIETVECATPF